MEIETYRREEDAPASYPATPDGLSAAAAALDPAMIWARIEGYIAHRWSERQVIWTVRGVGEFEPDLAPATITAQEVWNGATYVAASLDASPLGGVVLPDEGPYRLTATVGGGTVPAAVSEAFRRLAEYFAEAVARHGAGRYEVDLGGIRESFDRSTKWVAQAIQLSGAADLLRPYRRV